MPNYFNSCASGLKTSGFLITNALICEAAPRTRSISYLRLSRGAHSICFSSGSDRCNATRNDPIVICCDSIV